MKMTLDYINQLEKDKQTMYENLNIKNITVNSSDDFNILIDKVDEIESNTSLYDEYFISKPLNTSYFTGTNSSGGGSSIVRQMIKYIPNIIADIDSSYSSNISISGDNIISVGNITINSISENSDVNRVSISINGKNIRYIGNMINLTNISIGFSFTNNNFIEILDLSKLVNLTGLSLTYNTSLRKLILGNVKVLPLSSSLSLYSNFNDNSALEEFDFDIYDLKTNNTKIIRLDRCFYNCNSLKYINNFNNIDTSNVTDFSYCFYECNSLKSIDLSNLNFNSISDSSKVRYMFYNCNSLDNIDLSNAIFKNNTFYSDLLSRANAKKFILKNQSLLVDSYSDMFSNWSNLDSIDLTNTYLSITEDEVDISNMFYNCSSIKYIDLTPFGLNNKKISIISQAFNNCSNLKEIKMSIYFSSNCTTSYFLYKCNLLQKIDGIIDMTEFNRDMTNSLASSGNLLYGLSENTNELDIKIKNIKVSAYFIQASKVNFSEESINYLLNNVQDVTSNPKKLRFDVSVLAKASADAIAHAESLGWTVTT